MSTGDPITEMEERIRRRDVEKRLVALEDKAITVINRRLEKLEKQKLTAVYRAAAVAGFLSSVVTALILKWVTGFG